MRPIAIGEDIWVVRTVPSHHPSLVDRTGSYRAATADPLTKTISISDEIKPPLLDRVLLHEVTHAITVSHGLLPFLRDMVPDDHIFVEEWSADLLEKYSIEAIALASQSLDRPLCIDGRCIII